MSAFYCDFHGQLECDDAVGFNVVEAPQGAMYCCDDAMVDMEPGAKKLSPDPLRMSGGVAILIL